VGYWWDHRRGDSWARVAVVVVIPALILGALVVILLFIE
jgi:hypothetical protein